jgi:hypothetical protein
MTMTSFRHAIVLAILFAATAAAAPCDNCHGERVVGPGPVRFVCPLCDGAGALESPPAPPASPPVAAAGGPRPAVPRVVCGSGPGTDCGSGVLVDVRGRHALVLTAWHVVRGNRDSITIRWPDGSSAPARVVASDDAFDLAALVTAAPDAAPVRLAARPPAPGDTLTIAGYGPPPFSYREKSGPMTQRLSPFGPRHPFHILELRADARKGDSGGPILNANGELAAVLFGSDGTVAAGSDATEIRALIARAKWPTDCPDGRCAKR